MSAMPARRVRRLVGRGASSVIVRSLPLVSGERRRGRNLWQILCTRARASDAACARAIAEQKRDQGAERQRPGKEKKPASEGARGCLHHAHDGWPGKAAEIAGGVD